jgi:DNA repair exonuclease SbcCD ATPase subunit
VKYRKKNNKPGNLKCEQKSQEEKVMKTEKKSLLTKVAVGVLFIFAVVVGVVLVSNKNSEIEKLNKQYTNLDELYKERDSLVNDMAKTFDEIEENLTFVQNKRNQLRIDNEEGARNEKEAIVDDIKLMNTMLEESSKKIDSLNEKLKTSDIQFNSFKTRIARLTKEVEQQNASIAKLEKSLEERDYQIQEQLTQIAQLDEKVEVLETDIMQKEDSLEQTTRILTQKEDELNKAYFAAGTFKELKENGVVTRDGGFLFLGRSEKLQDNLNENYFTELDKRNTDIFPIFSKKAQIVSEHPDSSYRYIYDENQIAYLKIEDPEEFWKITRYAVVQVK